MKTYFYIAEHSSYVRGKNRNIRVYRNVKNRPVYIGSADVNTASYKGDRAVASSIVAEFDNGKLGESGYFLINDEMISV